MALCNNHIYSDVPVGDMGSLCPSYDFSFSNLLLKILLLREIDTLSMAVPKRMLNCCWTGFGLSSCASGTVQVIEIIEKHSAFFGLLPRVGVSPGSESCSAPLC